MNDAGPPPAIFFLSDYGTADEFVGVVHAVLHRLAPGRPVIDLSHQVPPFNVDAGAAMLVRSAPSLGPGVVLAVVDPSVGTARRGVAIGTVGGGPTWLVGPDNGLLLPMAAALGGADRVILLRPEQFAPGRSGSAASSRTFDGRDVFAPAAAHLVVGGRPEALGIPAEPSSLVTLAPEGSGAEDRLEAGPLGPVIVTTVTWVDHFGNVQLRLGPAALEEIGLPVGGTATVKVEGDPRGSLSSANAAPEGDNPGRRVTVRRVVAFAELGHAEWGLMLDASGQMALVLNRASAALRLGIEGPGPTVRVSVGHPDDRRSGEPPGR